MATICRKILKYIVVSTPKPVVNIDIHNFETGIFNVSTSIWQILGYQSLVLLAKPSKNQLQVGDFLPKLAIQHYLITVINILIIAMFPDILWVIGAAWAYSYQMHVNLTQKQHNTTYTDRGEYPWNVLDSQRFCPLKISTGCPLIVAATEHVNGIGASTNWCTNARATLADTTSRFVHTYTWGV